MASRRFYQFRYSPEADLVDIMMNISIGSSGAPTLNRGKGVSSIVRNSTGNYTITLQDNYQMLMDADYIAVAASFPASPIMRVTADNSATGSITIQFSTSTGTATDPGSGEAMLLRLVLKNSTI